MKSVSETSGIATSGYGPRKIIGQQALHRSAMFIAYEVSLGQTLAGSADVPVRKERVPASSGCPPCVCNADEDGRTSSFGSLPAELPLYSVANSDMAATRPLNIICFATFFKGGDFMRECHARGSNVILITKEKMLEEDWPRDVLADLFALPNDAPVELFIDLVSHIAQTRTVDRIIALEEFDVVIAALAREHLCLKGMSSVTAKTFRDKLSMSVKARDAGITVPDFVPAINHEEIADYLNRVPPPWVLKPRSDVSAIGIRELESAKDTWAVIEELNKRESLRERASYHLLARFIP